MMGKKIDIKAADIFGTMPERFRPQGAKGLTASFGYDIKKVGKWHLMIKTGEMTLEKTETIGSPDVLVTTSEDIWVGISTGQMDTMEAITSRKLIVTGDMDAFGRVLGLFHKYIRPGAAQEPEQELVVLKKTISVNQKFATGPVMGRFLNALKEKQILAIQCPECGRYQSPPREMCAICRVKNSQWKKIGPKGEMRMMEYCYYSSPDPLTGEARQAPYGAIGILLDGCKDEEVFWHLLRPDQLNKVKMGIVMGNKVTGGSRVRPVWSENRTGSIEDILYFELDH